MQTQSFDPILLEIINNHLISTCQEMAETMMRTSYSPIFHEGRDFSCAVFDTKTELAAQAEGCPSQLGALPFAVRNCVYESGGVDELHPGDVLGFNDAYLGNPHLPEFTLIKPAFYKDKHFCGFPAMTAHHMDVGGKTPGGFPSDATDIFSEGVIVPPTKLWIGGEENVDVIKMILSNTRTPRNTYGDINAQRGALVTAEKRLYALIDKYGLETFFRYVDLIKDYAQRLMIKEIQTWPDGTYHGEDFVDGDGLSERIYKIGVDVTVEHSKDNPVTIDFSTTDEQSRGPINCPFGVSASASRVVMMNLAGPGIPHNHGSMIRPFKFIIPHGTVANVNWPGALSSGNTETYNIICAAVLKAMSKCVPDKVAAADCSTIGIFSGGDPCGHTEPFVWWDGGGWGGMLGQDGLSAVVSWAGARAQQYPVEYIETRYRDIWRVDRYGLVTDSHGDGQFRGGLGVEKVYDVVGGEQTVCITLNRHRKGPWGLFGGTDGAPSTALIRKKGDSSFKTAGELFGAMSSGKFVTNLQAGDSILIRLPGGGGYGKPTERDRQKVEWDLMNRYISAERAVTVYGLAKERAEEIVENYWYSG